MKKDLFTALPAAGELIMLIDEEKEFVVICIAGSFTLEEIQEIAAGRNVQ
ncbi:MAG: DUF4252 domain-containing protein [Tannerella sp.]|nr:DUF4252 domain-containing protein [Tannerella sp.]